jgi:hypothetical protein
MQYKGSPFSIIFYPQSSILVLVINTPAGGFLS